MRHGMNRRAILRLGAALIAALPATAFAQADFPSRAIKIVVPLPPGATADTLPRIIGEKLTARWGQPIIIENKPGAAQNLGAEAVARSEPDGYTLLATPQGPLVISGAPVSAARLRSQRLRAGDDHGGAALCPGRPPQGAGGERRGPRRLRQGQSG